jgi:nicotinamidase-related amidase
VLSLGVNKIKPSTVSNRLTSRTVRHYKGESRGMPAKNEDLHGNVPDKAEVALLLIDVINDLEFDRGEQLLKHALPVAERIAVLKKRAKGAAIPVIYVNDNFGKWQSDFNKLLKHCLEDDVRGRPLAELLRPEDDDYFVLKPKHSGFFSTTLDTLLDYLKTRTLILTGVAANICVLFTANDAYMRDFNLLIPSDCVASNTAEDNEHALNLMSQVLKADTRPSTELDLAALKLATSCDQETTSTPAETPQFARKE